MAHELLGSVFEILGRQSTLLLIREALLAVSMEFQMVDTSAQ